eukprot:TRINITY_DN1184_c0_g1_i1.p1 TRINITY_DN1184_c0_g1~~TRINITY_DN1184_c0_g1_i1.p1  ORF type:complete len:699 (-),score=113.84 TRINITY_DN1184_c0_g1_i1:146-2242(-)
MPEPYSARGVAGERSFNLQDAVRAHGADIPNYRIAGEQHYRLPHKDKSAWVNAKPHTEWTRQPVHRTFTELKAARKAAAVPDSTFDIDGDGGVGPADYLVAKQFSRERDLRLNTGERSRAVKALESGLLDHYSFGYEQAGALRQHVVKQTRGKIFTGDNQSELGEVYPAHWSAGKEPNYPTATAMALDRKADAKNHASALKEAFDSRNPVYIPEPHPSQENMVPSPRFTHRAEIKHSARREARERGGLDAEVSFVNPHKECMHPGLTYVEQPKAKTETELREARRQDRLDQLAAARLAGEKDYIPPEARHSRHEYEEYERQRPTADSMTATKLNHERRCDYIEHNMRNFPLKYDAKARYSDQNKAWWTLREGYLEEPPRSMLKEKREAEMNAVSGKVTENTPPPQTVPPSGLERAAGFSANLAVPSEQASVGSKTVPRWTEGFVPVGIMARAPRMFDATLSNADGYQDGVKQAPTLSIDELPLDSFSSFRTIRENAGTRDPLIEQQSLSLASDRSVGSSRVAGKAPKHMPANSASIPRVIEAHLHSDLEGYRSPTGNSTRSASKQPLGTVGGGGGNSSARRRSQPKVAASKTPHGQDMSMTARLERLGDKGSCSSPMSATAPADRTAAASTSISAVPGGGLSVRTGGFQWLDSKTMVNEMARAASSTLGGGVTPSLGSGSRPRLGTETPRTTGARTPR